MRGTMLFLAGAMVGAVIIRPGIAQSTGAQALNHVGMVVENYDEAMAFYAQTLGLREAYTVDRPEGVQLEIMEFGPEALQRKAMESWPR